MKKLATALLGSLNLFCLIFIAILGIGFLAGTSSGFLGHGDIFGVLLIKVMQHLFYSPAGIIVLFIGGCIGIGRYKHDEGIPRGWGFGGIKQVVLVVVLAAVLLIINYGQGKRSLIRASLYEMKSSRILKESNIETLLSEIKNINSNYRFLSFLRLWQLVDPYLKEPLKTKTAVFSSAPEEEGFFNIFLEGLNDPHIRIRLMALEHMDDLVRSEIGKKYLTPEIMKQIRAAYLDAISDNDQGVTMSALKNIGNLLMADEADKPLFYRRHLLEFISAFRAGKKKTYAFGKMATIFSIFKAVNHRPAAFRQLESWAVELLEDSRLRAEILYKDTRPLIVEFLTRLKYGEGKKEEFR